MYSNLGIGFGRIINTLNAETCGSPINLFLIPEASDTGKFNFQTYCELF